MSSFRLIGTLVCLPLALAACGVTRPPTTAIA
ncbi:MAG: hypothetical protein JWQ03_425, partial [Variovorax sp.]|nr:hypothetical protein [Variovorax sp.]